MLPGRAGPLQSQSEVVGRTSDPPDIDKTWVGLVWPDHLAGVERYVPLLFEIEVPLLMFTI